MYLVPKKANRDLEWSETSEVGSTRIYLFLFFLILSYDRAEKYSSGNIRHFLRSQSQTTLPLSPRRAALSSPDLPSPPGT